MTATIPTGYGAAFAIGGLVRDAIVDELRALGQALPRVYVTTGAIAWDECQVESCGQLVVGITRSYLTDALPAEAAAPGLASGTSLGIDFAVQAIRCAPTLDGAGRPPAPAALEANAVLVLNDATAIFCATFNVLRQLEVENSIFEFLVRAQAFMGPEGACVGSELQFSVTVPR